MGESCDTYGREARCIEVLVGKSEGKRTLGRPEHLWEVIVGMDLTSVGRAWYGLVWFRVGVSGESVNELLGCIKCGNIS